MIVLALCVALIMLACLCVLQGLLAAGAPVGEYLWGGQRRYHGEGIRRAAKLSILVYLGAAAVLLARAGVLPGQESLPVIVLGWAVFAYAAIKVISNAMSGSRRQRRLMVPFSVVLMLAVLAIATH